MHALTWPFVLGAFGKAAAGESEGEADQHEAMRTRSIPLSS